MNGRDSTMLSVVSEDLRKLADAMDEDGTVFMKFSAETLRWYAGLIDLEFVSRDGGGRPVHVGDVVSLDGMEWKVEDIEVRHRLQLVLEGSRRLITYAMEDEVERKEGR